MAHAIILGGKTEIEADGLSVPNVQIAVGLWGKTGNHPAAVFVLPSVFGDDVTDKVRGERRIWCVHKYSSCLACLSGGLAPYVGFILILRVSRSIPLSDRKRGIGDTICDAISGAQARPDKLPGKPAYRQQH